MWICLRHSLFMMSPRGSGLLSKWVTGSGINRGICVLTIDQSCSDYHGLMLSLKYLCATYIFFCGFQSFQSHGQLYWRWSSQHHKCHIHVHIFETECKLNLVFICELEIWNGQCVFVCCSGLSLLNLDLVTINWPLPKKTKQKKRMHN